MKKIILKIFIVVLSLILSLSFFSCGNDKEEACAEIHSELQNKYLKDKPNNYFLYATGSQELSIPVPVKIDYSHLLSSNNYANYQIKISEYEDFKQYTEINTTNTYFEIYNLKIHTVYYYEIIPYINENMEGNIKSSFVTTSNTPRNLCIEAVDGFITNCRDLGGYKIGDKYTNQGLIFRTSKFNPDDSSTPLISSNGINRLVNELGIKSDLDLRLIGPTKNGDIVQSPLGENVNLIQIPMASNGNILTLNPAQIVDVFDVLGEENNYPIAIHCSIGTDRTGAICFLINALLGVCEEDLYRDYLFSNFGEIGSRRTESAINDYIKTINKYDGANFKEKTYNYLLKLGCQENDLNNLINIMTQ